LTSQIVGSLLVVGAHCFDAEVMAGGLIKSTTSLGYAAHILHLSMGELGHKTMKPVEYAEQKRTEALAAAQILNATVEFAELPDAFVPSDDRSAMIVCKTIRSFRPSIVVTHTGGSWHKDHYAASQATMQGVFYAALPSVMPETTAHGVEKVLFAENWEDPGYPEPSVYYDISDHIDSWRRAVLEYALGRGELCDFRYFDYYHSLKCLRGCLVGRQYAEAYRSLDTPEMTGICQFGKE
jgi:LmbE family N-acetylglucosaminyl deacetylase